MGDKEADKEGRAERLAAQLRANLRRRKEQARGQDPAPTGRDGVGPVES